ncbi:DMT family transporter [Halodurantibacterium flavum]|uniref:DMT family transporter n=1 Tax=Halodurantibacterium flavum TaxID=1382802 RepID=A0ABW4S545_9RHOB
MAHLAPLVALLGIGALWGLTTPLTKIAVGGGHAAFGIIQWQVAVNILVLGSICLLRRRTLPMGPAHLRLYLAVGLMGMVLPHSASYTAAAHLPAGVLSVVLSLVPLFALPVALVLGLERFHPLRGLGLALGAAGIVVLALPQLALPQAGALIFLVVAALAPLCYAMEGAFVAGFAVRDIDAMQTLLGASVVALGAVTPVAILTGQVILPPAAPTLAEVAILAGAVASLMAYTGYVWLLCRAGSVYAAQVAYLVTGCGVVWSMLLLGERYGNSFWFALILLFGGLFLVQPKAGRHKADVIEVVKRLPGNGREA